MRITRKAEFSASHRCYNPALPEDRNRDLYGESAESHGHGHNYVFEVSLDGEPDPVTGMVVDLKLLKDVIQKHVLDVMDHRHLNFEVPPFNEIPPTTENLALDIWKRLQPALQFPNARLFSVRLYETDDLFAEVRDGD